MNLLGKLLAALRPSAPTAEELDARAEAKRVREQEETAKWGGSDDAGRLPRSDDY